MSESGLLDEHKVGYLLGFGVATTMMQGGEGHPLGRSIVLVKKIFGLTTREIHYLSLALKNYFEGPFITKTDVSEEEVHEVLEQIQKYYLEGDVAYG